MTATRCSLTSSVSSACCRRVSPVTEYSIWMLEYGYVDRFPASNLFAAQPNEWHRRMPYCFGLVRSADRCVLVDTGFADDATYKRLTAKYGDTRWASPTDVLARAGVSAEQVDTVILTHNHFDHAGCAGESRTRTSTYSSGR
jgi:N-acyl homoserine lactone hydrolase